MALLTCGLHAQTHQPAQRETRVHDPSSIIKCKDTFWVFATGSGLISQYSKNLLDWQDGPVLWTNFPSWKAELVPQNRGHLWAPDIIYRNGAYWLYYSVSTLRKRESVIALATNRTLDPRSPDYSWKDCGPVVRTTEESNHNAIDPSIVLDEKGNPWMAYGSYWSGIKLVELDPVTGLRAAPDSRIYSLAWKEAIEAACLIRKGKEYFLFVNWGQCCRGTNSTYEIRVGKADKITGPYLDREGRDMMRGGGTLFLATDGKRIGPGHPAPFKRKGKEYLSYHYYDREASGLARLEIAPLLWKDGWPKLGKPMRK
jgi:arabinan endo-1,5-alpha-L-arabinosidase